MNIKYNCENCQKECETKQPLFKKVKHHFCGRKCYHESICKSKRIEYNCENCNKTVKRKIKDYEKQKTHFCSKKCHIEYRKKNLTNRTNKECPNCKSTFTVRLCDENKYVYCSKTCKKEFPRKNIDIKDVIDMYVNQKLGTYTIQRKYDTNQSVITKILQENGVVLRDKGWVLTNRPPFKGYKYTEEQKEEIRQKALKAYDNDPTLKDRIRQKTLEQISNGKMPKSNTSIEKIMQNLLTELKISFEFQKIFAFWCFDFYLPKYDLFIECDGDYWHGHPDKYKKADLNKTQKNNIHRGKQKETYVIKRGHKLIRFWEEDLTKNIEKVKIQLQEIINYATNK